MSIASVTGVVGHVARDRVAFALVDEHGRLDVASIRSFAKDEQPTVSGGLSDFIRDAGLAVTPGRCALAVAGVARGDAVSITNSPWFVSRSGLGAMLRTPPIILNDFAARAWALISTSGVKVDSFPGSSLPVIVNEGTYCLIGLGLKLGVAALIRGPTGSMTVIASEAGATILPQPDPSAAAALDRLRALDGRIEAYKALSGIGLVRIAQALRGGPVPAATPDMTAIRAVTNGRDTHDREALRIFCDVFWEFAANLTLTYGAWDGVVLAGEVAELLRARLVDTARVGFAHKGPHMRLLQAVPLSFATIAHGELAGAAMALNAAGTP